MSDRILSPRENELHSACMRAIIKLAQIYTSRISQKAIEFRMSRVADDLKAVVFEET